SQLYHAPQRPVQEITALDGRRVAVLEGSTQQRYFAQLLRSFGVEAELVVSQEFEAGFEAVQLGAADAVVSNHLFGNWQAPRYGLVASHIMFDPSRLFFAATPGRHEALLERIDERLLAWKLDQDSPYHAAMERWRYGDEAADDLPGWLGWSLGGLVSLLGLALLANLLLRRRLSDHLAAIRQVREDNRRLSLYDSLTGLPNRRHLLNHLRRRRE
uniref:transporter substrate-binding domain-containing protein n=1 Tax=Staphylococcus aureus TaxID=1280 RepID=UPI00301CDFD7